MRPIAALQGNLRTTKAVTCVLLAAVLAWALGLHGWVQFAEAASLQNVSDTITDSDLSANAIHDIQFTVQTTINAAETVRITFDTDTQAFDLSNLATSSVIASSTGVSLVDEGSCSGSPNELELQQIDRSADYVEYAVCAGDEVATSTVVNIQVGSSTASAGITNPSSASSYDVTIGGTMTDSGATRVTIIDNVVVSASVNTNFTFTIAGVTSGSSVNGDGVNTVDTTTATSMPFGILASGTAATLAQDLTVQTNAASGFTVTVQADTTLTSGGGADIDTFINGSGTSTPTAWEAPGATFGDENTYGHWGVTSEDSTLAGGDTFGAALYVGDFVVAPREVFYNNGPGDGTTADQGSTRVGYKAEVSSLQEAGSDYTATLTYVATPIF